MRFALIIAALAVATPSILPSAAVAQDWHDRDHDRDRDGRHDNGRHNGWDRGNRGRGDWGWRGDNNDGRWDAARSYRYGSNYRERRLGREDRIYRGGDGRYYCRRTDGTTGLVIGALTGGLLGNALGGNTLGTLLGAGGGAALGRSLDRGNVRCR